MGYEEGGYLTEAVRRKPFSVVLLDEIEKAHADVFNILLQVLDDGRLTDGHGRTGDFKNTVIIMTSNLGGDIIQELVKQDNEAAHYYAAMKTAVMEVVRAQFRPEFINRIDDVCVFHPLAKEHIHAITEIQLQHLQDRLTDRDIKLEYSDKALAKLSAAGFDSVYGARPLRRTIREKVENPLAQALLAGEIQPGQLIQVNVQGDLLGLTGMT